MDETLQKKRPVVGIMAGDIMQDYSKFLGTLLPQALVEAGYDVRLFLGCDPSEFIPQQSAKNADIRYHYYHMYSYARYDDFDVIVLMNRSLNASPIAFDMDSFMDMICDVPVVFIDEARSYDRGVSVLVDYRSGFKEMLNCMISSGRQSIGCITGPIGTYAADECIETYKSVMAENSLMEQKILHLSGNFSISMDALIEAYFDSNPGMDGICCGNDMMAEAVYRILDKRGIKVGEDVAVTGFDDMASVQYLKPPLTTVEQSLQEIAEAVCGVVTKVLNEGCAENVSVGVYPKVRDSCERKAASELEESRNESRERSDALIQWQKNKIVDLKLQSMFCSMLLPNLLMDDIEEESFYDLLGSHLSEIGAEAAYLFLIRQPIFIHRGETPHLPGTLRLVLKMDESGKKVWDRRSAPKAALCGMNEYLTTENPRQLMQFLLFFRNEQFGILLIETDSNEKVPFFHTLSLEIGSTLRYLEMTLERTRVMRLLREKNEVLDYEASHDKMTGLYNRSGILGRATTYLSEYPQWDTFVVMIADMDHLKQINDTFGHMEGDEAIISTAQILEKSLPEGSPIGRSGGDEYIALFHADYEEQAAEIRGRIKKECKAFNALSDKPYYVEISVGFHTFTGDEKQNFSMMMKIADTKLYEDKKHRRESVVRFG